MEAARRSGVTLRLPRAADAYQLGHVATETDGALGPLRQMAGDGVLLTGTLTRRDDGLWDFAWTAEYRRNGGRRRHTAAGRGFTLDAMQSGIELAARVLADRR